MIPVIVISLRRSTDRRTAIAAHLHTRGVPFSFFDAVDGNDLTPAQLCALSPLPNPRRYGQRLLPAEIGCAASFRQVCAGIAAGREAFVCVLEDDVTLDAAVSDFLDAAVLGRLPAFDILRIQHCSEVWMPVGVRGPRAIHAPYRPTYGTHAQIFSRGGAAKVAVGLAVVSMPSDMMVFSDAIVPDLRILELHPPLATHPPPATGASTIDPSTARVPSRESASWSRRLRRAWYENAARVRVFRNFVRQWGVRSVLRLRR